VTDAGRINRGGSADGGRETAQLAVMSGKASHTARFQRRFSIMGPPGLDCGPRGRPRDRDGLLMKPVETLHLFLSPLDLESAGGSIRPGERRRRFGHL
jgi:hypothetical protein